MPLPLDLFAEVQTTAGARYQWSANDNPQDRLRNFSFRTKLGEGFSDASGNLPRRVDLDYPDLNLVDTVTFMGADGSIAYEGRVAALPRELGDGHSVGVTLAGWMAHARDVKFAEVYVDRDISAWGGMSAARRAQYLTTNFTPYDGASAADPTDTVAGISTGWEGAWASPYKPVAEAWYDPGPAIPIARVAYSWRRESTNVSNADAQWTWRVGLSSDDKATTTSLTSNLINAGPLTGQAFQPGPAQRYAFLQLFYNATPAGADGARFGIHWYKLAAYGTHGLPLYTGITGEPEGVLASDVIRNICTRVCPMLDPSGVQPSSYVIQHLAFKDRIDPYDAFLEVNKYHLWHLGVWENRTLHFRPYDLTDYQWEVRMDEQGTSYSFEGPSTGIMFNGVVVSYQDVITGTRMLLDPSLFPELRDDRPDNPWNKAGMRCYDELTLSTPTLAGQALQIGRIALAQKIRPKRTAQITVRGYIRDRQGNDQPAWKVRAGDTVIISNYGSDEPRLIHETSWDDETKTLTLSVEGPAASLDAVFDRLANALTAGGLG